LETERLLLMLEGKDCREGRRVELLALGLVRDDDCCCMLLLLASVSICATAPVASRVAD
jgi:hypothetical protein